MDLKPQTDSSLNGIKVRKIRPQNIITRLRSREMFAAKSGTQFNQVRQLYTNIFPNFTVVNVEKPPCFLRKFSPDGRYFMAFSSDQTSIEIYEFQGPVAVEHLVQDINTECYGSEDTMASANLRNKMFDMFFKLKHTTSVAQGGQHLNRECSLFSNDGRFVIVCSAAFVGETPHPSFYDVYQHNECVSPGTRFPLEDYTLHVIELESGIHCDSREFKRDKISLSHNQGLYLYKDTLAVLSVQKQTVHIYKVAPGGSLIDIRSIGRFCYEDDQLLISAVSDDRVKQPYLEPTINSLKHRLLVFLYKKAYAQSESDGNATALLKFYQYFEQFKDLRMWKIQLLDEQHLLIRYASEHVVSLQITSDPNSQPSFFVVYNMERSEIVSVFENTSEELLAIFEKFCDQFRNATLECEAQFTCSPSSNLNARQIHQRFKNTIVNAKFGGHTEAIKRLLAQLPISAQSFSSSPYLDLALFSYDDKWVSIWERPKTCGDHPIRFYARDSGLLKFRIHSGLPCLQPQANNTRRLVAFTFHPFEPFAISVQRANSDYVVNFHMRHQTS